MTYGELKGKLGIMTDWQLEQKVVITIGDKGSDEVALSFNEEDYSDLGEIGEPSPRSTLVEDCTDEEIEAGIRMQSWLKDYPILDGTDG